MFKKLWGVVSLELEFPPAGTGLFTRELSSAQSLQVGVLA